MQSLWSKPMATVTSAELIRLRMERVVANAGLTRRQMYLRGYYAGLEDGGRIHIAELVAQIPPPSVRQALAELAGAFIGRLARVIR